MVRRLHDRILISVAMVIGTCAPAVADVTISNSATQNVSCAAGICAPMAATAVLNAKDLQSLLASGSTKVTTMGAGIQATNIRLAAKLSWSGTSALTLDAYKSVIVDKPTGAKGTGGLFVYTNDGGRNGEFSFGAEGHLTFLNQSSPLTINGTSYALVSSVTSLASAVAGNPSGAFALASGYDAGQDGTYAAPPISTVFSGAFNGLGNTISNLTINDPTENSYVGLFAETGNGAAIANIRFSNESVTGAAGASGDTSTEYIGGLVGFGNGGTIAHIFRMELYRAVITPLSAESSASMRLPSMIAEVPCL